MGSAQGGRSDQRPILKIYFFPSDHELWEMALQQLTDVMNAHFVSAPLARLRALLLSSLVGQLAMNLQGNCLDVEMMMKMKVWCASFVQSPQST